VDCSGLHAHLVAFWHQKSACAAVKKCVPLSASFATALFSCLRSASVLTCPHLSCCLRARTRLIAIQTTGYRLFTVNSLHRQCQRHRLPASVLTDGPTAPPDSVYVAIPLVATFPQDAEA
jgi:hypothetical protein